MPGASDEAVERPPAATGSAIAVSSATSVGRSPVAHACERADRHEAQDGDEQGGGTAGHGRPRLRVRPGMRAPAPNGRGATSARPAPAVTLAAVIRLDAATVLLQWAAGGMAFCWFTTRRREVGLGYGWLLRGTFGLLAVAGAAVGFRYGVDPGPRGGGLPDRVGVPGRAGGVDPAQRRGRQRPARPSTTGARRAWRR